jgi:hypothetical protein
MRPDKATTIALITEAHRRRNFAMDVRKMVDLKVGSLLRTQLGWRKVEKGDANYSEQLEANKLAKDRAAALIEIGEAEAVVIELEAKQAALEKIGESLNGIERRRLENARAKVETDDPAYAEWRSVILASIQARKPFDIVEADNTKEMERLAAQLPVAEWAESVKGLGMRSLAAIVGEAGDLASYPKKGHLWKRMGLAVIGGVRQGGLAKSASKQDWIDHRYSRRRRSQMFVIGDVMVKVGEEYRQVYLDRKDYERARAEANGLTVAPAAKIPKGRVHEFVSDGHIHRRAQRYMEKKLLRDLWKAWRAAEGQVDSPHLIAAE